MNTKAMFSSATDEWSTPQEFFEKYNAMYGFETDVCATAENAKCSRYFDKREDGLAQEWSGVCWMNPPYGREIGKWVKKAAESRALVCCLVPARTDTAWWHDFVIAKARKVEFVRGRLKFGGAKNSAPFPNAVVIFDGRDYSGDCPGDGGTMGRKM